MGIVRVGKLRAQWLLYEKPYRIFDGHIVGLLADLLLALATMVRLSGAEAVIIEDGRVEFKRAGRTVTSFIVASGNGHRGKIAVEADVQQRRAEVFPKSSRCRDRRHISIVDDPSYSSEEHCHRRRIAA